jgi:hypothetical protein
VKKSSSKPGKSKYALKVEKRRKVALDLGLKGDTPWPVIWVAQGK